MKKFIILFLMSIVLFSGCKMIPMSEYEARRIPRCNICKLHYNQIYYVRNDIKEPELCLHQEAICGAKYICSQCYWILPSHLQKLFTRRENTW